MKIAFVVPGKPVGKGRPRASTAGGHVHIHTPEATVTYENWVRACYLQNHAGVRLEGQLAMELTAVFEPPRPTRGEEPSSRKRPRALHSTVSLSVFT